MTTGQNIDDPNPLPLPTGPELVEGQDNRPAKLTAGKEERMKIEFNVIPARIKNDKIVLHVPPEHQEKLRTAEWSPVHVTLSIVPYKPPQPFATAQDKDGGIVKAMEVRIEVDHDIELHSRVADEMMDFARAIEAEIKDEKQVRLEQVTAACNKFQEQIEGVQERIDGIVETFKSHFQKDEDLKRKVEELETKIVKMNRGIDNLQDRIISVKADVRCAGIGPASQPAIKDFMQDKKGEPHELKPKQSVIKCTSQNTLYLFHQTKTDETIYAQYLEAPDRARNTYPKKDFIWVRDLDFPRGDK